MADLVEHSNLGIYYFDPKPEMDLCRDNKQQKKQTLTAELERMDAAIHSRS